MFRFIILLVCVLTPLVISKSISSPICGPVCNAYCMYGNVLDKHNCPTCQCKQSPWKDEQTPLDGLFCGRSPNRSECPSNYECIFSPNDTYAVCCPSNKQLEIKTVKLGSCPKPSGMVSMCIAKCTTANDCEGLHHYMCDNLSIRDQTYIIR